MDSSKEEILQWSREYLADLLEIPVDDVDPQADLDRLGVDSAIAVSLLIEVEERYGVDLAPEVLFEIPNLDAVATYLHDQAQHSVL